MSAMLRFLRSERMNVRLAESRTARVAQCWTLGIFLMIGWFGSISALAGQNESIAAGFREPPAEARPWVIWMWLSGNVTKEGITADLEAMQRVGLGGALIMDVDQNTPEGPMRYMDEPWLEMFHFAVAEAKRLGLELNVNNGPGYYGSGGPWIKPEQGMQTLVSSQTKVRGGRHFEGVLARPRVSTDDPPHRPWWTQIEPTRKFEAGADYRDVAVLALPSTTGENLLASARAAIAKPKDLTWKLQTLTWEGWVSYAGLQDEFGSLTSADATKGIRPSEVIDLTSRMSHDGKLLWNAPPGDWTVWRVGHAFNGSMVGPTPDATTGPETDKLSAEATAAHLRVLFHRLREPLSPDEKSAWTTLHVDSWEGGGQNWTPKMREEFTKRRGYDPVPFLPVVFGQKIGDETISHSFLWDLRKTVSELMVENYAREIQRLCRAEGLKFSFESYTTIGNDLDAANFVDEPIAEFWPYRPDDGFRSTLKAMASAAHLNGRKIVGAESFDADEKERWLDHPGKLKPFADELFTMGVNKVIVHRYAMQPFLHRRPGLQMGPWGQQYERTQTWWEFTRPWHLYLARCQYMLRQGRPVSDVLVLQTEEPLHRYVHTDISGYDSEACSPDAFANLSVKAGQLVARSGLTFRLLILDHRGCVSTRLLETVAKRVREGAALLGDRPPMASPGLGETEAEKKLRGRLLAELWGDDAQPSRRVGHGIVFQGINPADALARLQVKPDFVSDAPIRWIHRSCDDGEIYFLANTAAKKQTFHAEFRVAESTQPQWWDAETGAISSLLDPTGTEPGRVTINASLAAESSAFVFFPRQTSPLSQTKIAADSVKQFPTANAHSWTEHEINSAWTIRFPDSSANGGSTPLIVSMPRLRSWHLFEDARIKYFSGTASYSTMFNVSPESLKQAHKIFLDLGEVDVMAEVILNGRNLGLLWRAPFQVDVTSEIREGENQLSLTVTNLWVNRLIGDEQLPEDSERNADGTLKTWPSWLLKNKPSPTGRETFASWRLWKKDSPLQPSGLLGPVKLNFQDGD